MRTSPQQGLKVSATLQEDDDEVLAEAVVTDGVVWALDSGGRSEILDKQRHIPRFFADFRVSG